LPSHTPAPLPDSVKKRRNIGTRDRISGSTNISAPPPSAPKSGAAMPPAQSLKKAAWSPCS